LLIIDPAIAGTYRQNRKNIRRIGTDLNLMGVLKIVGCTLGF
jgi:hypothetical protein